jgi:hypothetical protein
MTAVCIYDAVDPEHRLVARTLEAQWEAALRAVEQVEHDYEQWRRQPGLTLSAADREALRVLGENFPTLWHAPTTTVIDRKRLLRLVIRDVLLDNRRARGQLWLQINWQTRGGDRALVAAKHAQLQPACRSGGSQAAGAELARDRARGYGNCRDAEQDRVPYCARATVQWSCGVVLATELGTATGGDHDQHRAECSC